MGGGVGGVVERMSVALDTLSADGDPARFFLGTYVRVTLALGAALDRDVFEDPGWVAAWDGAFADLYLDALDAHRDAHRDARRRDPAAVPEPWRRAFAADPALPPAAHVLLGVNAHVNFDQPQSLLRVVPPADFADPGLLLRRRRDHDRIDAVIAGQVAAEDRALRGAGVPRRALDRVSAPANRRAVRIFLAEARRKVWDNALVLHAARQRGPDVYAARLADLERAAGGRVADLLRPGPVLLRLAVRGFGVRLPPTDGDQPGWS